MKRIGYVVAGVVLGAIVALQLPSSAQTSPSSTSSQRSVTVTGTSTIKASPDEAIVSLGVQTQANTAQGALSDNAAKMTKVLAALADQGIAKSDIATSYVSLYPTYGSNGQDITGYQAQNQIDVTIHDLSKVGQVIDAAVGAGANLTNGITFQLSDQNQGVNQALADAVKNARDKAETLAAAGDASLGDVITIQEGTPPSVYPPVMYDKFAAAGAASSPTPIEPPTIQTQVTVTVTWALS
jgi:uncharacterized protein